MRFSLILTVLVLLQASGLSAAQDPAKPKGGAAGKSLRVELLPDSLGEGSDASIKDMPVPLGGKVRIAYVCHGENELAKAHLLYRVLRQNEAGKKPKEKGPWVVMPLAAVMPDDKAGPFNPKTGTFARSKFDEQVPFFASPPSDPDKRQVRILGGGRVLLKSDGLLDSTGKRVQTKPGDQIEYCVEVTERPRVLDPKGATERSAIRVTSVVTVEEFLAWVQRAAEENRRIRELERRQKDLLKEKLP